jgi:hypothetical protein
MLSIFGVTLVLYFVKILSGSKKYRCFSRRYEKLPVTEPLVLTGTIAYSNGSVVTFTLATSYQAKTGNG